MKFNMTLGQAVEAIALAFLKVYRLEMADKCNAAKIKFEDGKFHVFFADSMDTLSL